MSSARVSQPSTAEEDDEAYTCDCYCSKGAWMAACLLLIVSVVCCAAGALLHIWALMGVAFGMCAIMISFMVFGAMKQKNQWPYAGASEAPPENPPQPPIALSTISPAASEDPSPVDQPATDDTDFGPPPSYDEVMKECAPEIQAPSQ